MNSIPSPKHYHEKDKPKNDTEIVYDELRSKLYRLVPFIHTFGDNLRMKVCKCLRNH